MKSTFFSAYAVTNEIDLNKIAINCGIPKKYTWEEPLIMHGDVLNTILGKKVEDNVKIMVFSFGSVVFLNGDGNCIATFMEYLKGIKGDIDLNYYSTYSDIYELRVDESVTLELTDKYIIVPKFEVYMLELISTVIAKSVALEKTEYKVSLILDSIENMIDRLEKYNLKVSNKELANTTAKIIRHEHNTISYVMILDKPDVTWSSSDATDFYDSMAEFFELNDRYEILKQKTDILNSILKNFSSISHTIRGLFVEWVIVILIVMEVIIMLIEMFK